MKAVFYQPADFDPPFRTPDFAVTRDEYYSILVRGHDKSGKQWQVMLPPPTHGLWETDTTNGTRTYYFAGYTGGAGMSPGSWLLVLSFDERGRPVPFYIRGYAVYDRTGISDILNLDGTGPELVQQNWVETQWMPDTRSGYYITTLYQQKGAFWYRADGQHGTRTFPLYESGPCYRTRSLRWRQPPSRRVCWRTTEMTRALGSEQEYSAWTKTESTWDQNSAVNPISSMSSSRTPKQAAKSKLVTFTEVIRARCFPTLFATVCQQHSPG